jgi:GNAT superfamily N-acetyltransferase
MRNKLPARSAAVSADAGVRAHAGIVVRPFAREDIPGLLELMRELAAFEDYLKDFAVTEAALLERGFSACPQFGALVAVARSAAALVGMAVHYKIPYTYDLKPTLVLKELYVLPAWRGGRIGAALMQALARRALQDGCGRIKWDVLSGNTSAECFYTALGGQRVRKWVPYSMDEEGMRHLAKGVAMTSP